jgi:hypothetical protein
MMGAASRNLREPPAREYIGRVFSQHREQLEWLANFLTGDEKIAAACLVDACTLAESENPGCQEWLLNRACLATIRSAVQIQQRRIVQLSFADKKRPCTHGGRPGFLLPSAPEISVGTPSQLLTPQLRNRKYLDWRNFFPLVSSRQNQLHGSAKPN